MARMKEAIWDPVPEYQRMVRYDIACFHTIVGRWYSGKAAHFTNDGYGQLRQHRDTLYQSGANYNGNHRVIAMENEDHGPKFKPWNVNDGHAVPAFTPEQCESGAEWLVWCHKTHNIPLVMAPDSKPTSRGVAYHRMGCPGNFSGYDYPGVVPGGEIWTKSFGKVCPGDRRIHQIREIILPRARILAGLDIVPSGMSQTGFMLLNG